MNALYFNQLPTHLKEELTNKRQSEVMQTRHELEAEGHNVNDIWYTKLDYINKLTINAYMLYHLCTCGNIIENQKVTYEKPVECQSQLVYYSCQCGEKHKLYQ
jgi:hypothetical protein